MKEKTKNLFVILFMYIFIYTPPLKGLPFPSSLILLPIIYMYIGLNWNFFFKFLQRIKFELLILFLLLVYVFVLDLSAKQNVYFTHLMYYIFEIIPGCYVIVHYFIRHYKEENFYNLIIKLGFIAATVSLLAFIFPTIKDFLNSIQKMSELTIVDLRRNNGFSTGLLFAYSIGQGIIAVLCLEMSKKSYLYLIPFIIILISIMINARIGFVPIFIYVVYIIFKLKVKNIFFVVFFIIFLFIANKNGLFTPIQEVIDWNLSMFYDISSGLFGTTNIYSQYDYTWLDFIKDNFLVFPKSFFGWIFGEQRLVFTDPVKNSDIGYINDLIYGGLVLVIMISIYYIKIAYSFFKLKAGNSHLFGFLILFTYLITNLKGEFFRPNPANRILLLIYIYYIYHTYFLSNKNIQIAR
jgi:hypothetical protein